ncbi:MAG: hypothetical protein C5B52_15835 [Bacteroidetes bacterium]|nr:MAG: hypothetical protein C5B52_15835 [Bacteroidota bacterium]
MKQIIGICIAVIVGTNTFSQSDKYIKTMESKLISVDTTVSVSGLTDLSNSFQRIGDAEKTQWLPYYYAALASVKSGYMQSMGGQVPNPTAIDQAADKADDLIKKAEELSKDNSEIYCIKKMIATLKMMADPMTRWQTYGPMAAEALAKAKELNPNNPRVALLEGQDKFFTPEQYGGSKAEAKVIFEDAMKKYESFKPESSIAPQWGLSTVKYLYSQCK